LAVVGSVFGQEETFQMDNTDVNLKVLSAIADPLASSSKPSGTPISAQPKFSAGMTIGSVDGAHAAVVKEVNTQHKSYLLRANDGKEHWVPWTIAEEHLILISTGGGALPPKTETTPSSEKKAEGPKSETGAKPEAENMEGVQKSVADQILAALSEDGVTTEEKAKETVAVKESETDAEKMKEALNALGPVILKWASAGYDWNAKDPSDPTKPLLTAGERKALELAQAHVLQKSRDGAELSKLSAEERYFYESGIENAVLAKEVARQPLTVREQAIRDRAPWFKKFEAGLFGSGAVQAINRFFGNYQQYRGLGAYGALFMGDDELNERRARVNRAFCSTILLGGSQCWAQKICESYSDLPTGGGIAFAVAPGGSFQVVAHVEGIVSEAARYVEGKKGSGEYLYKVTYAISNPQKKDALSYNLEFSGERTFLWFPQNQVVGKGKTDARTGSTAIVAYSKSVYNKVCLVFADPVVLVDGKSVKRVCNKIGVYAGGPTPFTGVAPTAVGEASGPGREVGEGF